MSAVELAGTTIRRWTGPFAVHGAALPWICAGALEIGAGIHFELASSHAGSSFGTLSLLVAIAQAALGLGVAVRGGPAALRLALVLQLVLAQLYVVNVTVGLPPAIAHVHVGGVHEVLGLILAIPGTVDLEGVVAVFTEAAGALAAAALLLAPEARRG